MKRLLSLLLFVAVAVMAYSAYGHYQDTQEVEATSMKMRAASVRVINMAAFFKNPGGETYQEILEFGDASLKEVDSAVLALQAIAKPRKADVRDHAVEYLKACQVSIRNIQEVVRAKMAIELHGNAAGKIVNTLQRHVDDPDSLRKQTEADIAMYQATDALDELRAAKERFEQATARLQEQLVELVSIEPPKGTGLPQDIYVPAEKVNGMQFTIHFNRKG